MQKLTIRLLTLALVLLVMPMSAMTQDRIVSTRFFVPGVGIAQDVLNFSITFSRLKWVVDGTPTACSLKMEQSNDGISWTDFTAPIDCTSPGSIESIHAPFVGKFLRHNLATFTGAVSVRAFWEGFHGDRCGFDYGGVFSVIVGSNPAAGDELSVSVPPHERWRIYSAGFELQANSTVEDREVFLTASENGNEYFRVFADGVVRAGQKGIFTASPLGFVGTTGLGPSSIHQPEDVRTIMIPIYSEAFVPGGHTLATSTNGLQAGDDYSPAVVLVERCPD